MSAGSLRSGVSALTYWRSQKFDGGLKMEKICDVILVIDR